VLYCIIQNLVDLDRVYRPLVLGKRRAEKVRGGKRKEKDVMVVVVVVVVEGEFCCCYGARTRFGFLIYDDVMNRRHKARHVCSLSRSLSWVWLMRRRRRRRRRLLPLRPGVIGRLDDL